MKGCTWRTASKDVGDTDEEIYIPEDGSLAS
jgi:hypothetical protein